MPFEIHTLMQDTHDLDAGRRQPIENEMAADRELEVTLTNLVAGAPNSRFRRESLYCCLNSAYVILSLCQFPAICAVFPNLIEIVSRSTR